MGFNARKEWNDHSDADRVYREQNILGLVATTRLKDSGGTVVSQSEIVYDECPNYCVAGNRGLATSARSWLSSKGPANDQYSYLVSHSKFDQYGNKICLLYTSDAADERSSVD